MPGQTGNQGQTKTRANSSGPVQSNRGSAGNNPKPSTTTTTTTPTRATAQSITDLVTAPYKTVDQGGLIVPSTTPVAEDPYRGRQLIDDEKFAALTALGYDEKELRDKYLPKSQQKLAEEMGDMFWNAPAYKKEDKSTTPDESTRAMIMQQVLAPYLRQVGDQFNQMRTGLQGTQAELMKQIAPQYQPYLQAMNNATYAAQDQSWIDALNAMQTAPVIDQQNQLLADYVNAIKNQNNTGGDEAFLQSMGITL